LKVSLDTNILVHAEGVHDAVRREKAREVVKSIGAHRIFIPMQALNELAFLLFKKGRRTRSDIAVTLAAWMSTHGTIDTTHSVFRDALSLSALHKLQIFDAVVLASAAQAGCSLLLSEDMHDGFTWRGCTVVNPFAVTPNPLLEAAYQT
jgi:predicted nucleic acid-binding protein